MGNQDYTETGRGLRNPATLSTATTGLFPAGPGNPNPFGIPFAGGNFTHGTNNCIRAAGEYCSDHDELDSFDDFDDEVIRELSFKWRSPDRSITTKVGKFQRGWGQSDGLRLIDILHAQDLRERFVFKDTDEVRIPAWMGSADFNLKKLGVAGPFEALGMKRPVLEVNIVPEVRHSEFIINNPTAFDQSSGGAFGLQWPEFIDDNPTHGSGLGAVGFGANLREIEMDDFDFGDSELSARLKFQTLGGTMTLNAFSGTQDLPIVKMAGANFHIGSGNNDAAEATANGGATLKFDAATTEFLLWAPEGAPGPLGGTGGYMPYLRAATLAFTPGSGVVPIKSPLSAFSENAVDLGGGLGADECADPVTILANLDASGNPTIGTGSGAGAFGCSVSVDMDLDYTHDQNVVAMSFTRDMADFISFGPKNTSPSIRLEISHEFDKPFNKSVVSNPFGGVAADASGQFSSGTYSSGLEQGAVANFVQSFRSVVERDVTSIMVGFDYPLWVPGWDSQQKSIFTSFQYFNIHTEDHENLMAQAPYGNTEVVENQNYATFLFIAPLDNQRLVLEGLLIKNIDGHGTAYRQRIDFNYFGKNWRPRFEYQYFSGRDEVAPVGIFNDKDFFEISVQYQF